MAAITLDGQVREVEGTPTVLDVARRVGIEIPTLCHHEALGPYGACRLCVVEAEGPALRRSLVTSCTLPASDGLSVATCSPAVLRARKILFELLLGRSPHSPQLRDMAKRHGVEWSRFGQGAEEDDCVRCGLCVRACRDRVGRAAITFAGRGQKRHVSTEFGKLSTLCIGCGTCAALCPTGAIRMEDRGAVRTLSMRDRAIARLDLLPCRSCGVPYTTREQRDHVASRLTALPPPAERDLCRECARARGAASMAGGFPP